MNEVVYLVPNTSAWLWTAFVCGFGFALGVALALAIPSWLLWRKD